jgi:hypothetical protein
MNLIWQFICMITFGAACWAAGGILLKGFLRKNIVLPPSARHPLAFATGNIAFSYLLTGLGFFGGFVPAGLWTVFFGGIGIAILYIACEIKKFSHLRALNQLSQERIEKVKEEGTSNLLLMVVIGLFFLPAILQAAAPPYVRDSLVYHLYAQKNI